MRRLMRQTRADLFWVAASFVALQLGLAVAIECWLPQLRDSDYADRAARLRRRMAGAPERPLSVVLLGSSRSAYGLQGLKLEEQLSRDLGQPVVALNLGSFGCAHVMQRLMLKRLLADGIRPDLLLVEVVPPLLAAQHHIQPEVQRISPSRLWLDELPLVERYGMPAKEVRRAWWQGRPLSWYTHRFEIVSQVSPTFLPYYLRKDWGRTTDASGWGPHLARNQTPAARRQAVELARQQYAGYFAGFRLGGPSCLALRDLLEHCRAEGIRAALVLMPEGSDFRSWYAPEVWAQIEAFLNGLSREFTVPVLNAREWVGDDGFSDSHHLLPDGAAAFTERLGRESLPPLLERAKAACARPGP